MDACDDARWRVEAVQLGRGTGVRSWFEVHGGAKVFYCSTADQVHRVLAAHAVATADLAPPHHDSPADQDGCE
jgi:hypothetical protein